MPERNISVFTETRSARASYWEPQGHGVVLLVDVLLLLGDYGGALLPCGRREITHIWACLQAIANSVKALKA